MIVVKAPENFFRCPRPILFLSGSIEMGQAENWQSRIVQSFPCPGTILNPRRDDWDASWKADRSDARFIEQVRWELQAMEAANRIALYLSPATKSPISLLELGLWARSNPRKLVVCCPDGFWRQGNVELTCELYAVMFTNTFEHFVAGIQASLEEWIRCGF